MSGVVSKRQCKVIAKTFSSGVLGVSDEIIFHHSNQESKTSHVKVFSVIKARATFLVGKSPWTNSVPK